MDEIPTVTMKNGGEIPMIGAGTWSLELEEAGQSVRKALEVGYNHVDTAEGYRNETEIGKVLRDYERSNLFLTSKVLPSNLHYDDVLESCEASLNRLDIDYLDLYLIHWPNGAISVRETLQAMRKLYEEGKVRNIGVSNFSKYQLRIALRIAEIPICVNQIEINPWYYPEALVNFCQDNDVVVTASAPLGRTQVLEDELIKDLAEKYGKSPAQIALKWEVQKNFVTIPRSTSEKHIAENLRIFDWELEDGDVEKIDNIPKREKCYMIDLDDEIYGIPP